MTPDTAAALTSIGITAPQSSRWRRLPPSWEPTIYFAEVVCVCGDRHKRVTMIPFTHDGRTILIGQCSVCLEIVWCNWMARDRRWTGPTALEPARPMYAAGQGA